MLCVYGRIPVTINNLVGHSILLGCSDWKGNSQNMSWSICFVDNRINPMLLGVVILVLLIVMILGAVAFMHSTHSLDALT